jgi:hypothetical protein
MSRKNKRSTSPAEDPFIEWQENDREDYDRVHPTPQPTKGGGRRPQGSNEKSIPEG